jgi:tetratricopeptide (TPR) repeat protein
MGEAAETYRVAVGLAPRDANLCLRLGNMYEELGRLTDALQTFTRVIELAPGWFEGYAGVCRICIDGNSVEEGEAIALEVTRHINRPINLMKGMLIALKRHGRYPEARTYISNLTKYVPNDISTLLGAAKIELALRNVEAAGLVYDELLTTYPTNPSVMREQAKFHIITGRFGIAIELFRAALPRTTIPSQLTPMSPLGEEIKWDGAQDLRQKTVLLRSEGKAGFGDYLQDYRFAPLFKERDAYVICECPPPLKRLLASLPGIDEVVAPYDECSPVDYTCSSGYASMVMDWTWEWVANNSPYLSVAGEQQYIWLKRLGENGLKIGVCWRSSQQHSKDKYSFKSIPLSEFHPLAALPGVKIFGLQVGPGREELIPSTREWVVDNLGDEFVDFNDTAAAVMALDAVVTVDTAMAHLAGALGKTCFVALPYNPCLRWMSESEFFKHNRCLLYPSMRVFRQDRPGDWSSVMREMTQAVIALAHAKYLEPATSAP